MFHQILHLNFNLSSYSATRRMWIMNKTINVYFYRAVFYFRRVHLNEAISYQVHVNLCYFILCLIKVLQIIVNSNMKLLSLYFNLKQIICKPWINKHNTSYTYTIAIAGWVLQDPCNFLKFNFIILGIISNVEYTIYSFTHE